MSLLAEERTLSKRKLVLQSMFKPLVPKRVDTFARPSGQDFVIGLGLDNFGSNLRLARHKTKKDGVLLNYFEAWTPKSSGVEFFLEKAYLHLDALQSDGTDIELLALHCDPEVSQADAQYKYKRGPHFHISAKQSSFHKAHLATCLTCLEQTCADIDALTKAITVMIKMIDEEMLPHL